MARKSHDAALAPGEIDHYRPFSARFSIASCGRSAFPAGGRLAPVGQVCGGERLIPHNNDTMAEFLIAVGRFTDDEVESERLAQGIYHVMKLTGGTKLCGAKSTDMPAPHFT